MNTEDKEAKKPGFAGLLDLAALEYRWPKKGDRLLRAEDDWQRSVAFEERQISRHVHIWEGYMKAGAALVDQCERGDNLDRHQLVYPILFCYRHGLELAMKPQPGRTEFSVKCQECTAIGHSATAINP